MLPRTAGVSVAALVVLFLGDARAADQGPARRVQYREDRMSVDLQRAPLAEVMDELGRQSGAAIRGQVCKPRELTLWFEDVPLPAALERVLGEQNFTLRYGPDGRLEAVDLLGEPGSPVSPAATGRETGSIAAVKKRGPRGSGPRAVGQGARGAGLSVSVLGGPTAANGQASAPGSPVVVGSGLQATARGQQSSSDQQQQQQDPTNTDFEQRIRRSLLNSLSAMDDPSLAAFMDTPEGKHVQALLQYYADHHVGSTRQQEAAGIIQRLPNAPSPTPGPGSPSHHTWR